LQLVLRSSDKFDAILLDVDNGPIAMTDSANQGLYNLAGIQAFRRALRKQGSLAIWSTVPNKEFEKLLMNCGFQVRRYRVKAYPASHSKPLFIWVAAQDGTILPPGGSDPSLPGRKGPGEKRVRSPRNR